MASNLPNEQKTNWTDNQIVRPVHTNGWGEAINKLTDAVPLYSACGDFYTATYSNNTYILTPLSFLGGDTNQTVSQYVDGMRVVFKCPTDNLGASTVNVNSLGNKSIKTIENVDVKSGKLKQGAFIELRYDATNNCFKYIEFSMGGNSRNIGEIIQSSLPLTDAGLHLLDGTRLSGDGIYKEFVEYIAELYEENPNANCFTTETDWQASVTQYGSCGKFVYDSELNTVRLPKVSDILQGTTDISALGDLVEESLPNIRASIKDYWNKTSTNASSNSAIYFGPSSNLQPSGASSIGFTGLYFDASRSSSTYQDNAPVQPQTIKALLYIVVATSTKTDIQVDIDEIATDLNGKADVDLTNTTDQAKILMGSMAMPSDKYIDLTLGASNSTYTAPANGYYRCYIGGQSGYKWLRLETSGNYLQEAGFSTSNNICFTVPIQKGQTLNVKYSGTLTGSGLRFIYAQGSESEA